MAATKNAGSVIKGLSGNSAVKFILLFLLISTFQPHGTMAQWTWQNPTPQGNDLNGITFMDTNNGWAVGDHGVILHTVDGGISWEASASATTQDLTSIVFSDATNGVAVGPFALSRTTDGGNTWQSQTSFSFP